MLGINLNHVSKRGYWLSDCSCRHEVSEGHAIILGTTIYFLETRDKLPSYRRITEKWHFRYHKTCTEKSRREFCHWDENGQIYHKWTTKMSWWRHQTETFSALLAICARNSPVPVNSPHKGQWCGTLMFSLISAWINGSANNPEAGDLRRNRAHYDVIVMWQAIVILSLEYWFNSNNKTVLLLNWALGAVAVMTFNSHVQYINLCWHITGGYTNVCSRHASSHLQSPGE